MDSRQDTYWLTWPDLTWPKCTKTSVSKTNMTFAISNSQKIINSLYELQITPYFPDFWVIDLAWKVNQWPRTLKLVIIGFLASRATRSFFPRSSSSTRGQTTMGFQRTPPPHTLNAGKTRIRARAKTPVNFFILFVPFHFVTHSRLATAKQEN